MPQAKSMRTSGQALEETAVRGRETDVVALLGAHDGRAA
jgi:hypothetical protein